MKKEDLSKSIRRLMTIGDRDAEKVEIYPLRDWRIVSILFGIGFVGSVWYHMYLFMNINEDNFFAVAPSTTQESVAFDGEKIAKTIAVFDEQDAAFEQLKAASITSTDPSL